ncbi:MAG: hypothetical protein K2X87_29050 [Gemmataceae bacterium]|nr:hypothetical protein [Gemmataceae bacterium]
MRNLLAVAAVVALGGAVLAAELKSGPQAGQKVPGPFHPLNINGEAAGKKNCLFCSNGDNPVAVVFARNPDCPATQKLIKALDAAAVKNEKAEMGTFTVFLGAEDKLEAKLKAQADEAKFKKMVLSIESPEGPAKYNIAKDADVTVLLYKERTVAANHAFEKGKLTDADIEKVVADVSKIVK